jgi:hypothetical protein
MLFKPNSVLGFLLFFGIPVCSPGCRFDTSGLRPSRDASLRDKLSQNGDASLVKPDQMKMDRPGQDQFPHDQRSEPQQGMQCQNNNVTFLLLQKVIDCQKVDLTIKANQPYTWVMARITAPSAINMSWQGGAINVSCSGNVCSWTIPALLVPCVAGPFTLHFMIDAANNDPSVGQEVAGCTP